jgi:hypothetical protein
MKLPPLLSSVNRADAKATFRSSRMEGVQPAAVGTCYDNADCQTRGIFKTKGKLCENCTIAQCDALGGQAWTGSLRMFSGMETNCWPMNAGLVQREQMGMV